MIDINRAGMTQLEHANGTLSDWLVTVDGETIFTLSKDYSVQQMFEIRDTIKKMMDYAHEQGKQEAEALALVKIQRIADNGNAVIEALKEENIRLAEALEQHILSEEI